MIIVFDDEFEVNLHDTFDMAVCKIEWAADTYGFTKADVISAETGEILIQWTAEEG
jgi:hypothetical protein